MRNCDGVTNPGFYLPFEPGLRRCPWSAVEYASVVAIEWWHDRKRFGSMPFGGHDLMTQPAYVYEAMHAVDDAVTEIEREAAEKERGA
jgi:hypothetical protein